MLLYQRDLSTERNLYFPKTEKKNSLNNDQKKQKAVSWVIHKKRHEEIWLHYARLLLLLF